METLAPSIDRERIESHFDGRKTLEESLDRCRRAISTEDHTNSWNTLIENVRQCNDSTTASWVAEQVLIEWPYNALYSRHMDRLLQVCGTVIASSTCCLLLKKLGSTTTAPTSSKLPPSSILEACCATLRHQLLSKNCNWPSSPFQETKTRWERFVKLVLSIPALVANACHSCKLKLPLWATTEKFFPRLLDSVWSNDSPIEYRIALMKAFLAHRSNATPIALGLASHHPLPTSFWSASSWNDREICNLIWAFLQHSVAINLDAESAERELTTCQILLKHTSVEQQQAFVQNMILKPMGDVRLCPLIISLLDKCDILRSSLCELAEEWSKWTFCHHVPPAHQHFVSQLILQALPLIPIDNDNSTTLGAEDNLTLHLLQGVTHRLESFVPDIRLGGMRVAQQVAKRTNQELQFDELIEAEQNAASSSRHDLEHSQLNANDRGTTELLTPLGPNDDNKTTKKKKTNKKDQRVLDPDAEYNSDDEVKEIETTENTTSDDDDASTVYEDELVPYSLDDDEEDLVMTPKPLYLLRALELLRTGEGDEYAYSHHETAMRALPELIRKRPDDLPDVAISLLMEFLRIEDKFGIDSFLQLRQQSLVALAVCEPLFVGKQMIESVFLDNTLSDRLACFGALQEAAYELSGSKDLDQRTLTPTSSGQSNAPPVPSIEDIPLDGSAVQMARLQSKTRRKRSPRLTPAVVENLFTAVAPQWFYLLTGQFLKNRDNKILWSGSTGSQFLASLIRTLAVFVEFAGIFAAPVLAKDLMDLVWSFLDADVGEVRMAVLTAIATSFLVLPQDHIMSIMSEQQMDNFPQVITSMSRMDPDSNCRQLATTISQSMVGLLGPTT